MGFYGRINNNLKTQFTFSTVYATRKEMDESTTTDGIRIGQYVLVDYDSTSQSEAKNLRRVYLLNDGTDGWLYSAVTCEISERIPASELSNGQTVYTAYSDSTEQAINVLRYYAISIDDTVTQGYTFGAGETPYTRNYNIDIDKYQNGRGYDSTVWQKVNRDGILKYAMIAELNSVVPTFDVTADAPTLYPLAPHFDKDSTNVYYNLHDQATWGVRTGTANDNLKSQDDYLDDDKAVPNPLKNIPLPGYGESTEDNLINISDVHYQYDKDKNALYMTKTAKKGAVYINRDGFDSQIEHYDSQKIELTDEQIAELDKDANSFLRDKIRIKEEYDEDTKTTKKYAVINDQIDFVPTGYSGQKYKYHKKFTNDVTGYHYYDDFGNPLLIVDKTTETTVATNVYYKDQGDKYGTYISYYDIDGNLVDKISGLELDEKPYPDIQEATVYLPALGNAMSNIWNLIYGTGDTTNQNKRKRNIAWNDHTGIRLVNTDNTDPGTITQDYNTEQVATIAGAINSAHDIMGMIIDDVELTAEELKNGGSGNDHNVDAINNSDDEHIYYNKTDKKYYKRGFAYDYDNYVGIDNPGTGTYKAINFNPTEPCYSKYGNDWLVHHYETEPLTLQNYYDLEIADVTDSIEAGYEANKYYQLENVTNGHYIIDTNDSLPSGNDWTLYNLENRTVKIGEEDVDITVTNRVIPLTIGHKEVSFGGTVSKVYAYYYKSKTAGSDVTPSPITALNYIIKSDTKQPDTDQYYFYKSNITKIGEVTIIDPETEKPKTVDIIQWEAVQFSDTEATQLINPDAYEYGCYYKNYNEDKTIVTKYENCLQDSSWWQTKETGTSDKYLLTNDEFAKVTSDNFVSITIPATTPASELVKRKKVVLTFNSFYQKNIYHTPIYNVDEEGHTLTTINKYAQCIKEYSDYEEGTQFLLLSIKPGGPLKVYVPSVYYYFDDENQKYILDQSDFGKKDTDGNYLQHYIKHQYYVVEDKSDTAGDRTVPYMWNLEGTDIDGNPTRIPDGITIATREPYPIFIELEGFDYNLNTMHGLILQIRNVLDGHSTTDYERDNIQGSLNTINDIIDRFKDIKSSGIMTVDELGHIQGSSAHTEQEYSFNNIGTNSTAGTIIDTTNYRQIELTKYVYKDGTYYLKNADGTFTKEATGSEFDSTKTYYYLPGEDNKFINQDKWINISVNPNNKNPFVSIKHEITKVQDTKTIADKNTAITELPTGYNALGLNNTKGDTLNLYTPIVDKVGHIVGNNTETVTLPYGYKTIATNGRSDKTTGSGNTEAIGDQNNIIADNTQDTLAINSGDIWTKVLTNADTDTLTIYHDVKTTSTSEDSASLSSEKDVAITFKVYNDTYDATNHFANKNTTTLTMPNSYGKFTSDSGSSEATATHDTFTVIGDRTQKADKSFESDGWIQTTASKDQIKIEHIGPVAVNERTDVKDLTPAFNDTFTIEDWRFDSKGHKAGVQTHTVKIPGLELTNDTAGNMVTGISYEYDTTNHKGVFTESRSDISIKKKDTAETGFLSTYYLDIDNVQVGASINIPKDFLVKSGTLETVTEVNKPYNGAKVGDKYLDFILNTKGDSEKVNDDHLYVPVNDLFDSYTSGSASTDAVVITVDNSANTISASITDSTISRNKINAEFEADIKTLEDLGDKLDGDDSTDGSIKKQIKDAVEELDATVSQTTGDDGLALSITETDGKITAVSGSITNNVLTTTKFEYSPAVEGVHKKDPETGEETEEWEVEPKDAVMMTIAELMAKVKELEDKIA